MTLERTAIRNWASDRLMGKTDAGLNVIKSKSSPQLEERAAGVAIYTNSEDIEIAIDSSRVYRRTLELAIEVFVRENPQLEGATPEELADRLMDQCECCLLPALNPAGLGSVVYERGTLDDAACIDWSKSGLVGVDMEFDAEGVRLLGAGRIRISIDYSTAPDERELANVTSGPHTVGVDWDIHPDEGPEAEDTLEIEAAES